MTVAHPIFKLECSQTMDRPTMDGLLTPADLKNRSMSCMSELVQGLHIRNVCFEFDGCGSSHSLTRVFISNGWMDDGQAVEPWCP